MQSRREPGGGGAPSGFEAFCRQLLTSSRNDGRVWIAHARIDSTNSVARRLLQRAPRVEAAPNGTVCIVAWEQTAGRGRRGRSWESSSGLGLYMTILLREVPAGHLPELPLVTVCALASVVDPLVDGGVRVKWPNDLLWDGRKLAGILVESTSRGGGPSAAIVGIGLNCHHTAGELPLPTATSLRLAGAESVDKAALAREICGELERRLSRAPQASDLVEELRLRTVHRQGDLIRCRLAERELEGRFVGIGDDGALLLERRGAVEEVRSSEIVDG